jgi:hypothetical protein
LFRPSLLDVSKVRQQRDKFRVPFFVTDPMNRLWVRGLHFSIRAIIPGDYKLFAWEALENNAYFDPELIKQVESQGKPIHVGESSRTDVEVRAIPVSK